MGEKKAFYLGSDADSEQLAVEVANWLREGGHENGEVQILFLKGQSSSNAKCRIREALEILGSGFFQVTSVDTGLISVTLHR